ncbi:MAG: PfkB family carbohydrate kinase [Terracidiphilus sp.]|jgi:sugar/nucleoside kinase (ribokinase family)
MSVPRVLFLGRTTLDLLYRLDSFPGEDTKVYARDFHAAAGGPALNAAMTHSLLGGQAMLVSAVGGGPWSIPVRAELDRQRIALLDLAAGAAYETPATSVLINDATGSRTIVNPSLSTVFLPPLAADWQQALPAAWTPLPPVVLTDGFHLEQTLPLLASCQAAGVSICLDGGSWKPGTAELAPLLTVAICSERFTVPGQPSPSASGNPDAFFAWFAGQGVPHVALTRGPRSILAWDRGRRFEIEIASVNVADSLGAGDVLHGAFCHFYALNPEFEPALRRAAKIATLSCQALGTQAWATRVDT